MKAFTSLPLSCEAPMKAKQSFMNVQNVAASGTRTPNFVAFCKTLSGQTVVAMSSPAKFLRELDKNRADLKTGVLDYLRKFSGSADWAGPLGEFFKTLPEIDNETLVAVKQDLSKRDYDSQAAQFVCALLECKFMAKERPGDWRDLAKKFLLQGDQPEVKSRIKGRFAWAVVCEATQDHEVVQQLSSISPHTDETVLDPEFPSTITHAYRLCLHRGTASVREFFCPVFEPEISQAHEGSGLSTLKGNLPWTDRSSERRMETSRAVIECICRNGEEITLQFLKMIVDLCNVMDISHPTPGDEWVLDAWRIRMVMALTLMVQPSAVDLVTKALMEMKNVELRFIIALAIAFDVKDTAICEPFTSETLFKNVARRYILDLAVVFASLFLKLEPENVESFANNIANRNKRMKVSGYEASFVERCAEIIKNPSAFRLFMSTRDSEVIEPTMFLEMPYQNPWDCDMALSFINKLMGFVDNDTKVLREYIGEIAEIIRRLVNYVKLDHGFLARHYLSECLEKEMDVDAFQAAYEIMKCSSVFTDITNLQEDKWSAQIRLFFTNGVCCDVALKAAEFSLSRLAPSGFFLSRLYLQALEKVEDITQHIHTVVSIYSFCLNQKVDEDILPIIRRLASSVVKAPRTEVAFNVLTALFMVEVSSDAVSKVSGDLWALFKKFFELEEDQPSDILRMFAMFPQLYHVIHPKCEEFYDTLVDSILKILKKPKTSDMLFQILIETIVDVCVRIPNGSSVFSQTKKRLYEFYPESYEKFKYVREADEEYMAMYNHPLHERGATDHADVYVLTPKTAMHKVMFEGQHISTKTKIGCWSHTISVPTPEPDPPYVCEPFTAPVATPPPEDELATQFSSIIEKAVEEGILCEFKPSDFSYENPEEMRKSGSEREIAPLTSECDGTRRGNMEDRTGDSGWELLHQSYEVTALFTLLFGDDLPVRKPSPLLDIAASNLFGNSVRECCKIGLLYVKRGQSEQNSILQNTISEVSDSFKSFLASIGVIVDLAVHEGFSGKLDTKAFSNGRYQLYYANDRFEILYHVAPLLTTNPRDEQQIYKKRHIGNDNVHVVWSENDFEYEASTITSQFNDAHVIIYPLRDTSEFFRVVTYKKSPEYHFGPLWEELVLHVSAIPELVTWTVIFSDRMARQSSIRSLPNELFLGALDDIATHKWAHTGEA